MSGLTRLVLAAVLGFIIWLPASAQDADSKPYDPLAEKAADNTALIHFGDLIDVDVLGSTDFDWRGTLNPEGYLDNISFLKDPVYGLCMTEQEVARQITADLSRILRDPVVVVKILDRSGRPEVLVFGAVRLSQRIRLGRRLFLNELLILSGGLTDRSRGEIQITRPPSLGCSGEAGKKDSRPSGGANAIIIKVPDIIAGRPNSNPEILPGDIVTAVESQPVYLIGGVAEPKQLEWRPQLTLTRAVASAGGLARSADTSHVTIFRRVGGRETTIDLDYRKVAGSDQQDVALQPFDVVDIAEKGRERRKSRPIVREDRTDETAASGLPLRVVD
jgi:protein involved in polysaccharide export with SLBB domain